MAFLGLIMAFFFVPRASELAKHQIAEKTPVRSLRDLVHAFNPMGVFRQFRYPNILAAVCFASPFRLFFFFFPFSTLLLPPLTASPLP